MNFGEVDVGELSFTPPAVEEGKAWQLAIPFEADGVAATVYVEFVVLRENDTIAALATEDVSDPFDQALRDELVQTLADRMTEPAG